MAKEKTACSLLKACFSQVFKKKERSFLVYVFSEVKIVREHSSCFTAYKHGIMLQRFVGLQLTVPRLMHEYFMWVFSLLAYFWLYF